MGDSCNRDQFLGERSSTRTHHHMASHHSKSNWSLGWGNEEAETKVPKPQPTEKPPVVDTQKGWYSLLEFVLENFKI